MTNFKLSDVMHCYVLDTVADSYTEFSISVPNYFVMVTCVTWYGMEF